MGPQLSRHHDSYPVAETTTCRPQGVTNRAPAACPEATRQKYALEPLGSAWLGSPFITLAAARCSPLGSSKLIEVDQFGTLTGMRSFLIALSGDFYIRNNRWVGSSRPPNRSKAAGSLGLAASRGPVGRLERDRWLAERANPVLGGPIKSLGARARWLAGSPIKWIAGRDDSVRSNGVKSSKPVGRT